jgi:3',5'-cyclic AMP phosphodiesterase CpdA
MKIAHISDLHLDIDKKKQNNASTYRLLEYIHDNRYDHIIISGDITENAEKGSFMLARQMFARFGMLNKRDLTLTIGNHDIFGGVHLAEDVINFPGKCKNTNYYDKISAFAACFEETLPAQTASTKNVFPFVKELDSIVLVSLCSVAQYSYLKNPFASNGRIKNQQIEIITGLLKNIPESKKRIIVTHHHFNKESSDNIPGSGSVWKAIENQTMKLRGKKKLLKSFNELNAELILHGHLHENLAYKRSGINIQNAGGSILSSDPVHMYINSIEISGDGEISQSFIPVPKFMPEISGKRTSPLQTITTKDLFQKPNAICLN